MIICMVRGRGFFMSGEVGGHICKKTGGGERFRLSARPTPLSHHQIACASNISRTALRLHMLLHAVCGGIELADILTPSFFYICSATLDLPPHQKSSLQLVRKGGGAFTQIWGRH